jgi:hypothetical protein
MSLGDHWDEPARCSRCGQERSTHDDGLCEGIKRSMLSSAKPIQSTHCGYCGVELRPEFQAFGFCDALCLSRCGI